MVGSMGKLVYYVSFVILGMTALHAEDVVRNSIADETIHSNGGASNDHEVIGEAAPELGGHEVPDADRSEASPEESERAKSYEFHGRLQIPRDEGFNKKTLIKYLAIGGLVYHFWYYKLETLQACSGALSHFFIGTNYSAAQAAQMKILARTCAYGGVLLSIYGLMGLYEDAAEEDYKAALEIRRMIAQYKVTKKKEVKE